MKYLVVICLSILVNIGIAQRINPHQCDQHANKDFIVDTGANLSNDTTIDIKFYHLDVKIALDSAYIEGSVKVGFVSLINNLTSIKLDLDSAFVIDSISSPSLSYVFSNNIIDINFSSTYNMDDYVDLTIYYKGAPVLAGGYKGLRYENHDDDEIIIASLSTPYLAHTWWPCKDGTQDKSDSTFIDITIKDTVINFIPVIATSNGILVDVESVNGKKTFQWKHYYPVVPYYIMVAISNYQQFQQIFDGGTYSFPIDYYVFESHFSDAQDGVALIPDAMEFFTDIFGPYPFRDEKYGMTQLGYYGAIENQTNTITNNMSMGWFFVSVHELAHMWFADMITCNTWHHGWLNEGFASYAEALFSEYQYDDYHDYMNNFIYYGAGKVYMEDVSNPFTVFQPIIYNKGAYVLHMLRNVVGEEVFFDILYSYANSNSFKYGLVTTEEFQDVCEDISGLDLGYFFEQWIYDERYPMYYYNYEYNSTNNDLGIVINQLQGVMGWREQFTMPLEINVEFVDGTDSTLVVFNDQVYSYYSFNLNKEVDTVIIDPENWVLRNIVYDSEIIVNTEENVEYLFDVYPNPSKGTVSIRGNNRILEPSDIDLIGLSGTDLNNKIVKAKGNVLIIENLSPGIYLIKVRGLERQSVRKIIVWE